MNNKSSLKKTDEEKVKIPQQPASSKAYEASPDLKSKININGFLPNIKSRNPANIYTQQQKSHVINPNANGLITASAKGVMSTQSNIAGGNGLQAMASLGTVSTNSGQTIGPPIGQIDNSPRGQVKKVRPTQEVMKSQQEIKNMGRK
jgi:hypothetical protein